MLPTGAAFHEVHEIIALGVPRQPGRVGHRGQQHRVVLVHGHHLVRIARLEHVVPAFELIRDFALGGRFASLCLRRVGMAHSARDRISVNVAFKDSLAVRPLTPPRLTSPIGRERGGKAARLFPARDAVGVNSDDSRRRFPAIHPLTCSTKPPRNPPPPPARHPRPPPAGPRGHPVEALNCPRAPAPSAYCLMPEKPRHPPRPVDRTAQGPAHPDP